MSVKHAHSYLFKVALRVNFACGHRDLLSVLLVPETRPCDVLDLRIEAVPTSPLRSPLKDYVALVCVICESSGPSLLFFLIADEPDFAREIPGILSVEAFVAAHVFDGESIQAIARDLLYVSPKRLVDALVDPL
jgi:hypothetical protein